MINNLLNVFGNYALDFIKMWLVFRGILSFSINKNRKVIYTVGILNLMALTMLGLYRSVNVDFAVMGRVVIVLLVICFLFQGGFIKRFSNAMLTYICVMFADICFCGILSLILHKTLSEIINNNILNYSGNSISIILISAVVLMKRLKKNNSFKLNISKRIYVLLFAGAGTGSLLVGGLMVTTFPGATDAARQMIMITAIIACVAYCAACLMLVFITESRDNFKTLSQINQSVIEAQQRYYLLVQEKQQEIRSIRHEMKNHFACINGLLHAEKYEEMEQYINELIEQSDNLKDLFDTGNDIVNAILNDVQSRYQKYGIRIRLEGAFPQELYIAPMDLCVIFANAVSNAVEAIHKIEFNKNETYYIDIRISSFKDDLYIDIKNPVSKQVDIIRGNLITSKQDKSKHGFGTKNMKQCVEKYHGTINFSNENYVFFVEIHMKNK